VKSHTGIVGNEIADELAKEAAQADIDPQSDSEDTQHTGMQGEEGTTTMYDHPGSGREGLYWPVKLKENNRQQQNGGHEPAATQRPLHNLGTDLKQAARRHCRLGAASQNTIYFSSWSQTEADRDPCSHHMMHNSRVSGAERTTALKYRTGTMYTAKQRYRFKLSPNSKCLLCGHEDGGHHTASGCSKLLKLYTHRHNTAGRIIMRAVQAGRLGANVVMMDLGISTGPQSHSEPGGQDTQQQPRRIPREVLPQNMPEATKSTVIRHSIPDAFLYQPGTPQTKEKYTIVEIKYCRDTDPTQQLEAARDQHRELEQALKTAAPGAEVEYITIMLGVSGTVFKTFTNTPLQKLGISKGALRNLKYKLHCHAVKQLHWIYRVKRRKEMQAADGAEIQTQDASTRVVRAVETGNGQPSNGSSARRKRRRRQANDKDNYRARRRARIS
jgi:hypothetical protein